MLWYLHMFTFCALTYFKWPQEIQQWYPKSQLSFNSNQDYHGLTSLSETANSLKLFALVCLPKDSIHSDNNTHGFMLKDPNYLNMKRVFDITIKITSHNKNDNNDDDNDNGDDNDSDDDSDNDNNKNNNNNNNIIIITITTTTTITTTITMVIATMIMVIVIVIAMSIVIATAIAIAIAMYIGI